MEQIQHHLVLFSSSAIHPSIHHEIYHIDKRQGKNVGKNERIWELKTKIENH